MGLLRKLWTYSLIRTICGRRIWTKYSLVTPSSRSYINESQRSRYLGALNELDHWLNRTRQAEQMHLAEKERLLSELERMQREDNEKIERLEEIFRRTLLRDSQPSERLRFVTETALKQMRAKRDALSATRLILIIRQHDNSYIKKKVDEIEAISGEVKLETYLSADNDVQQMVTTLNNKNAELERMCTLVKNKIHTISHLRCRRKLLNRKFREAKDELRERQKRKIALRDEVYNCNLTHNKLLDQIKEVRREGGIMCYPKLLADFDRTEKFIAIKQASIVELKTQHDNLLKRIEKIELKILESNKSEIMSKSD
uniref:SD07295p n=1 Tax=Drosophila melanogaster TaxID=7227 RepID=Q95SU6_DROME|nr:SD07295p [Drosophila melanogaster]